MSAIDPVVIDNPGAYPGPGAGEPPAAGVGPGSAAHRLLSAGAASLLDQAIVSGTSFVTVVVLGRCCSQEELGVYYLAWTLVLFVMAVQANLICVPYTMYAPRRSAAALASYAGSTLVHQAALSALAVLVLLALGLGLRVGIGPGSATPVAWVLAGVVPLVLLREYARRLAFARLALGAVLTIDILAAAVQVGGLALLGGLGRLSVPAVYGLMGGACAAAVAAWLLFKRQPFRIDAARVVADWRENWAFGRWAVACQLLGLLAFYQLPWILTAAHGEAATGVLAAGNTLVGLANLFVAGMVNLLTPKAAHAYALGGAAGLRRALRAMALLFAATLGPFCLVAILAGNFLAVVVFGAKYAGTGPVIGVMALATFCEAFSLTAGNGLWAMDRPSRNFTAEIVQTVVMLPAAVCLVIPFGALGAGAALVISRAAGAAVRWWTVWSLMRAEPAAAVGEPI